MNTDFKTLQQAARWYRSWMSLDALPLWARSGVDPANGSFYEALTLTGLATREPRRARVQARQVFVFANAALVGLPGGDWAALARRGLEAYLNDYRREDGLFAYMGDGAGRIIDPTPYLYEQDFSMLAMSAVHLVAPDGWDLSREAAWLRSAIQSYRHPAGGFREMGARPFQSNAHMHLLETCLAWEAAAGGVEWSELADEIVALALGHFIDPDGGYLREFFSSEWRPAEGDDGAWVEPGHQFEWAWLLERWSKARGGDAVAHAAARRLFERGRQGVDLQREVAINTLWDDLTPRDAGARLWPQTEYLRAALMFGAEDDALIAARGLARYLDVPVTGGWRDKMLGDGKFIEEPVTASSFYHLWGAVRALAEWESRRANPRSFRRPAHLLPAADERKIADTPPPENSPELRGQTLL